MTTELSVPVQAFILTDEDGAWSPLPAELGFSMADPIASAIIFAPDSPGAVTWFFAFDLIHRVSVGWSAVGVGDIRFSHDALDAGWFILRMKSPDGEGTVRLFAADVKKYVNAVKEVLDSQPEVDVVAADLDREISAILEGSTGENPVD